MSNESSLEILKRIRELQCQLCATQRGQAQVMNKAIRELLGKLEFSLNEQQSPAEKSFSILKQHLQSIILAADRVEPEANLARAISEAESALQMVVTAR